MSKFKPTKSQQEFLDTLNKNTLVSASAGSGKTSTMINKLTNLIIDGVELKKMLVVTYTNAAGNEMKQKLFSSLLEELQTQTDEKKIDFISEQIDEMSNCDIGTLHSVCKKIITSYFYVVGQDPAFSLLNEQQSAYLFDNAITKVFNDLICSDNEEFYSIYKLFNKKRNLANLKYIVQTLHNYLLSKVEPQKWERYVIDNCCSKNNPAEAYLLEYFKKSFSEFESELLFYKQVCNKDFELYLNYVGDRLNFVKGLEEIADYEKLFNYISKYEFVKKPRVSKDKITINQMEICEKIDLIIGEFGDLVKQFKKSCEIVTELDYVKYRRLVEKLFKLTAKVNEEYILVKKAQNVLDFSDLEHITLKILEDSKVREALKNKYQYIFVDEYQDINQVQEEIISRIKRDDNLYMIGDVKQSIYAFRLSSPEIFIDKFNKFQTETDVNKLVCLNENFRSEENILEFSNLIFNALINKKTIGIDYEGTSQLVAGKTGDFKPCVSMDIVDGDSELSEAVLIAKNVVDLVKQGFNYKDIAILLRSKGDMVGEIYSELKKYNIPCDATYRTDLFRNNEVLVMYYLLKLADNTNNDLAMATALKSLFVGLNDDELAEIRLIDGELNYVGCVYKYLEIGENNHIVSRIKNLFELLGDIRFMLNNKPIIEVLNWLFNKYDVNNYYLSFVDGLEKIGNLREFLNIISNEEFKYDLKKCLDFLDGIKKNGDITLNVSSMSDSVKIMTIHSSKGLEYPAVILGGIGKNFVLNKQTEDIIINDTLGVGVKIFDEETHTQKDSVVKLACKIKNKHSEINEEIRLLYVALTRAKSKLCIVGKCDLDNINRIANKNVYSSRNYFELMLKAFPKTSLHFFENRIEMFKVADNTKSEITVRIIDSLEVEEKKGRDIVLSSKDNELEKELGRYFDYVYPYSIDNNVAIKNSVSQVLKEERDYENSVESIALNSNFDDYSLKLGTAYHTIMQNLKYTENLADIKELINKIKTPDLPYQEIEPNKILNAVNKVSSLLEKDSKILKEAEFIMKANYKALTGRGEDVDILVQGVIDLVIVNKDSAIVVDFKTNKTKSEKSLIDSYGLQLKMYSDAFEKATNLNVKRRLLYSFEMDKFIEV